MSCIDHQNKKRQFFNCIHSKHFIFFCKRGSHRTEEKIPIRTQKQQMSCFFFVNLFLLLINKILVLDCIHTYTLYKFSSSIIQSLAKSAGLNEFRYTYFFLPQSIIQHNYNKIRKKTSSQFYYSDFSFCLSYLKLHFKFSPFGNGNSICYRFSQFSSECLLTEKERAGMFWKYTAQNSERKQKCSFP